MNDLPNIEEKLNKYPLLARLNQKGRRLVDKAFARWVPEQATDDLDWMSDAEWARLQQEPLIARSVFRAIGIVLIILVLWAALAQVDEVTRGTGKVIPSKQVQIIQAVDGGVVEQILVREGQAVEKGQMLAKIDPTRFVSSLRENQVQYLALQAKAARLRALAEGTPFVMPPEVTKEDPALAMQEESLYLSRRSELDAQISIARQQLAQRNQELIEIRARRDNAANAYELTNRELQLTRPLANSGAVSEVELMRLERDVSRYRGERDQAAAQIARIQAAIAEASRKIQEVELTFRNQASTELSETMAKLGGLSEGSAALTDRVVRAEVRSPVKGTIKRLLVTTEGGVVQPGTEIIEVVPTDDTLLLEARVQPKDIAFLHPGQKARVRFTAYDFAVYGALDAVLEHIGADTVTDDKGNAFYIVRVRTTQSSLGKNLPILPGMVADVDIMTGKKTVLSYLLKPVLRAHSYALTER